LNISVQTGYTPTTGTREAQNQTFINKRVQIFKGGIKSYVDERDMQYSLAFLKLIAASDNWAKNTYIYNAGIVDKESGKLTSKWRFFQDDLDTILSLDNSGYKVKPYYVEEHDSYVNDKGETVGYWNASDNAMYCLAEMAWESENRAMMREILSAMKSRAGSVFGNSPEGCFDRYYGEITRYIPAVAYNEITRKLYEDAEVNRKNGLYPYGNTVDPLAQAVGDQLQAESQWQKQRSTYLSSYASYGIFASGSETQDGSLAFRAGGSEGSSTEMRFIFKPSMWLYPSMANGSSSVNGVVLEEGATPNYNFNPQAIANPPRVKPGQSILFKTTATADQTVTIRGIDYYNDIGDLGQVTASSKYGFPLSGRKLEQFKITDDNGRIILLPSSLSTPTSGMDNIKRIEIRGKVNNDVSIIGGMLDLSGLWRLNYVDVTATSITSLKLPSKSGITTLKLPSTLESVEFIDQYKLDDLTMSGIKRVNSLKVSGCPKLDTYELFNKLYTSGNKLNTCHIDDVNWEDITIKQLVYLNNIYDCRITGVITVKEGENLDFNTKAALLNKFGNIDDVNNDLYISYPSTSINTSTAKIVGDSYLAESGDYTYTLAINGNSFNAVKWSISDNAFASIDQTGKVTYNNIESDDDREATIQCAITIILRDGTIGDIILTKKIYFRAKVAEIGDYVYSDGSISTADEYNSSKTVIGICFYVNPNDPMDRRMIAVEDVAKNVCWGASSTGIPDRQDLYDIANIPNVNTTGSPGNYTVLAEDLLDNTTKDGFKVYGQNYALGDLYLVTLTSNLTSEIPGFVVGSTIPSGQKKTLEIIEHRNEKILKSNIDTRPHTLRIPGKNELGTAYTYDELDDLSNVLLPDISSKLGVEYQAYYYPAASYCYAYSPDCEELDDKFKTHNWYLPTYAEVARAWYCQHTGLFAKAISVNDHNFFSALEANYWTSTEQGTNNVWDAGISGTSMWQVPADKSVTANKRVRPVARF
jgi:hypothetical protein